MLGLIASAPGLRPADVLTAALGGSQLSALNVGVACPDAQCAGEDCTESMRRTKVSKYAQFFGEFNELHILYRPLIWSCYGREHSDTSAALIALARRAARRRGYAHHKPLLARARAAVGLALARRCANMVLSCQARLSSGSRAILS